MRLQSVSFQTTFWRKLPVCREMEDGRPCSKLRTRQPSKTQHGAQSRDTGTVGSGVGAGSCGLTGRCLPLRSSCPQRCSPRGACC